VCGVWHIIIVRKIYVHFLNFDNIMIECISNPIFTLSLLSLSLLSPFFSLLSPSLSLPSSSSS
jgi:hypothetical protein